MSGESLLKRRRLKNLQSFKGGVLKIFHPKKEIRWDKGVKVVVCTSMNSEHSEI